VTSIFNSAAAFKRFPKAKYVCFEVHTFLSSTGRVEILDLIKSPYPLSASEGSSRVAVKLAKALSISASPKLVILANMIR
jgi:hypothetical protein